MSLAPTKEIVVGVGDHRVSRDPNDIIATYALGSCLGITAYDSQKHIGGMLHAMLPKGSASSSSSARRAMFIDTGFEDLIKDMSSLGANVAKLEFKVFGGAKVLEADKFFRIGEKNAEALTTLFAEYGYRPAVWEVGGALNRTIKFSLSNGQVKVKMPNQPEFYK